MRERLLRHEREDDAQLYPAIERALGGDDPIAAMHRTHREVQQLGGLLARMTADLPREGPSPTEHNASAACSTASTPSCGRTSLRRTSSTTAWPKASADAGIRPHHRQRGRNDHVRR